jgi:hypothetical protein
MKIRSTNMTRDILHQDKFMRWPALDRLLSKSIRYVG